MNRDFLGNNLTCQSGRFLKALTSLETLYVSLVSLHVNSLVLYLTNILELFVLSFRINQCLLKNSIILMNVLVQRKQAVKKLSIVVGLLKFLNYNRRTVIRLIIIFVRIISMKKKQTN